MIDAFIIVIIMTIVFCIFMENPPNRGAVIQDDPADGITSFINNLAFKQGGGIYLDANAILLAGRYVENMDI